MATPKNKFDRQHLLDIARYQRQINEIFGKASEEAAKIGVTLRMPLSEDIFTFADYPVTKERINKLLEQFRKSVEAVVVNGINAQWTLSNNKNSALCDRVFGSNNKRLTPEQYKRYYNNNDEAREAFLARKEQGLALSDKVWKYTNQFKQEIELGLDVGIRNGSDAAKMARELNDFLQHPDKLFRRVRDEHGILKLSKAAKDFHPGQGVYRSSYKNARRLAATETNMAYRTADHERWQQLDFVVGIEIHLSNNHTCLGADGKAHAFADICDDLQGRYPKDFKFTGWHPHCRCYATAILKSDEEFEEDEQRMLDGEQPSDPSDSDNAITETPGQFNEWVEEHQDKIHLARLRGREPYFLRDNTEKVDKILGIPQPKQYIQPSLFDIMEEAKTEPTLSTLEKARLRHEARTPEQIADIQKRWEQRLIRNLSNDAIEIGVYDEFYSQHISHLRNAMYTNDTDGFKIHYENVVRSMKILRNKIVGAVTPYTPHTAMKTEYKTLDDVRDSLKTIGDEQSWFPTGRMKTLESASMHANGSSNRSLGLIRLTPERSKLVQSAMTKIGNGKSWKMTKAEADAMSTLWHEMNHQMHSGDESAGDNFSESRSYMELANEFVSRRTLPDFYKSMGCKTTPYPGFIEKRTSTGYDDMVRRYQYVIDTGKLKLDDVLSSVRNGLLNSSYDKQKTVLIDGLIAGGIKGKRADIAKLVEMCESEQTEESILKFMKEKGLI